MSSSLIMTGQLILGLSLLVFVHELGHFLAAKAFGMRVNKFFIFFDAWGKKIWSKKIGETEYGIGWLPLGGYVQIAGMIDETQDASQLSAEPEEWEFRAKPAWQRFIVMIGGIVMNVITGLLIFAFYLYSYDGSYLPVNEVNKHGIYAHQAAQDIGFQTGDKVISVNGKAPERFKDISSINVLLGGELEVNRNGQNKTIKIPDDFFKRITETREPFISPMYDDVKVELVAEKSNAEKAGLKAGDQFASINGKAVERFTDLQTYLLDNKNGQVNVGVLRDGQEVNLQANVDSLGRLGFMPSISLDKHYAFQDYNVGSAFKYSYREGYDLIASQVAAFGMMFTGKLNVSESLSSPIGIARIYGGSWDWARFWRITGLLSFILAFMNILPIPALDGGHMLFILVEIITGRKLSDEFLEKAQIVGFMLLMGLIVFAVGNDIYKIFR